MYASIAAGKSGKKAPTSPPIPSDPNSYASRTSTPKKPASSPQFPTSPQSSSTSKKWPVPRVTELSPLPNRRWTPNSSRPVPSCPVSLNSMEPVPTKSTNMMKLTVFSKPAEKQEDGDWKLLHYPEFQRLRDLFNLRIEVNSKSIRGRMFDFRTVSFTRNEIIIEFRQFFTKQKVRHYCFLIGGATCHIIDPSMTFSDVDIDIELDEDDIRNNPTIFEKIRRHMALMIFRKLQRSYGKVMGDTISDADLHYVENSFYGKKIIIYDNVTHQPLWSLFQLRSTTGQPTEIKFTAKKGRSFILLSDSLKIQLEPVLAGDASKYWSSSSNFPLAIKCIEKKLIYTEKPEEIVGGGFLKVCMQQIKGWTYLEDIPPGGQTVEEMKQTMLENFLKFYFEEKNNFSKTSVVEKFLNSHYEITHDNQTPRKYADREKFLTCLSNELQEIQVKPEFKVHKELAVSKVLDLIIQNKKQLQWNVPTTSN